MTAPDFPRRDERETATSDAPPRPAPVRFEPTLIARLLGAQQALNARFAGLVELVEREPKAGMGEIEDCARHFGAIRHIEAIALYPLLAQAVESDPDARGQLLELRLIALVLSRRVQRCFDELLQAARAEVLVADATRRLAAALTKYSSHSVHATYPLYDVIGAHRPSASAAA